MAYEPWAGTSQETQYAAFEAANAVSTQYGRSRGGYIRLARVSASGGGTPYVIATRRLKNGTIQFSCGCANWKFKRQSSGTLCKHQESVLTGGENHKGKAQVWYYKAGGAFVEVLGHEVEADAEEVFAEAAE
jgi:hypothetical protein